MTESSVINLNLRPKKLKLKWKCTSLFLSSARFNFTLINDDQLNCSINLWNSSRSANIFIPTWVCNTHVCEWYTYNDAFCLCIQPYMVRPTTLPPSSAFSFWMNQDLLRLASAQASRVLFELYDFIWITELTLYSKSGSKYI